MNKFIEPSQFFKFLCDECSEDIFYHFARFGVSLRKRELEILMLLLRGKINRHIAEDLKVSEKSVKYYLTHAFRVFQANGFPIKNRSQIIPYLPFDEIIQKWNAKNAGPSDIVTDSNYTPPPFLSSGV